MNFIKVMHNFCDYIHKLSFHYKSYNKHYNTKNLVKETLMYNYDGIVYQFCQPYPFVDINNAASFNAIRSELVFKKTYKLHHIIG